MSNSINIIILVETSPTEKENFLTLAHKENWNVQVLESSYDAIRWLKQNNNVVAVILSEDTTPLNAYHTFDYIRQELKSKLPIVISKLFDTNKKPDGYTYIEKPYSDNTIEVLKRILQLNNISSTKKIYSLNYLETISGGNHEFVMDCLKIFISSVKDKMDELKIALTNNNNENISAIAHNIKPSFEMLENDKAKDICNTLIYDAETSDISSLATQLNAEFKAIESALKEDFTELR